MDDKSSRLLSNSESHDHVSHDKDFSFSSDLSLEKVRELQAEFSRERNWDQYHTPRNLLLAMVGEVGEVSELFQWKGECQVGLPDWGEAERTSLSEELSDVLIYLVRLSEQCHIDLPQAVLRKLELNRRKYPAEKVYGSSKKYTEYSAAAAGSAAGNCESAAASNESCSSESSPNNDR